jgi:hypothetical protein
MTKRIREHIPLVLLSIFLGGICLYLYMCFAGVFAASMIDIGYYKVMIKLTFQMFDSADSRLLFFETMNFLKDVFLQLFFCTMFLYWFSFRFRRRIILSCFFLLMGALMTNYYWSDEVFGSFFSYTPFFNGTFISYIFNIILWTITFFASIIIASNVKTQQSKKH